MADRKSMSKKTRFEVFKRDKFACQYCGAKAPDVLLHVDHINPVSKGGKDALLNLVTACVGCNGGKSARTLDDSSVVEKQRRQLEELQGKREQIDMMIEWQTGLADVGGHAVDRANEFYTSLVPGWSFNESGKQKLRAAISEHGLETVLAEMRAAVTKHLRIENEKPTEESAGIINRVFFDALKYKAMREKDPVTSELLYIRGIMRRRFRYCPNEAAIKLLREAHASGVPTAELKQLAFEERNWTGWEAEILARIGATKP
jgi:hypothetical protein